MLHVRCAGYLNKILKEEGFDVVAVAKSESKTVPRKRKPKTESLEGKKSKKYLESWN